MPVRSLLTTRLLLALGLLVFVIALSVVGYAWLEGWSWFDSLYMTVTTITTLGGGEPRPLSVAGKWWTLAVIVLGVGAWAYTFLAISAYLLEGTLVLSFRSGAFAGSCAR